MRDFGTKQDDTSGATGQFTATEANSELPEVMNIVTTSGQALDNSGDDVTQLAKAMANYAAGGDYYTATGTNTYILSPLSPAPTGATQSSSSAKEPSLPFPKPGEDEEPNLLTDVNFPAPTAYIDGMSVRVFIANANTGASTVNINSLGARNVFNDGSALTGDEMTGNCELVYASSSGRFNLTSSGIDGTHTAFLSAVNTGFNLNKTGAAATPTFNLNTNVVLTVVNGVELETTEGTDKFLNNDGTYRSAAFSGGLSADVTLFQSDDTYTVPADVTVLRIVCIGGGGGGGSVTSTFGTGGGGGSGGYAETTIDVVAAQDYDLVVGAGGTAGNSGGESSVTFSATEKISSTGGSGGTSSSSGTNTMTTPGGEGGSSTVQGGISGKTGAPGSPGIFFTVIVPGANRMMSGNGGLNPFGAGGAIVFEGSDFTTAGVAGALGGGGSGSVSAGNTSTGGTGGAGAIFITAFKL